MGKTRDLFKKIRDKGTFHAKMGSIKDRNGIDLTEAEDIKKRWQEYTEEWYNKDLHDPDNHDSVITRLKPDILECEVKWEASLRTKLVEGIEFQLSYSKSWKVILWKCCTQYGSKFGKLSSGHRTGKGQFSFQSQRKAMPKNVQTTAQLHSSHTLAKYCSKFFKPGFNSKWTVNFQMFKLDSEKAEEPEIKLPTSTGSSKKQESSIKKNSTSALLTMPKPLTVWITTNCEKIFKRWEYQITFLPPEKSVYRSRSNN